MFKERTLNGPELKQFTRIVNQGELIFRAGEPGKTMFLILQGEVGLYDESPSAEHLVGRVEWGQVFGEQAIVAEAPYERAFTARTLTRTKLLEFDLENLRTIERLVPDFTLRILQITAKWLARANELTQVLRPQDDGLRLVKAILFLAQRNPAQPGGNPTPLTAEQMRYLTDMDTMRLEQCLNYLSTKGVLRSGPQGYIVADESRLRVSAIDLNDFISKRVMGVPARVLTLRPRETLEEKALLDKKNKVA